MKRTVLAVASTFSFLLAVPAIAQDMCTQLRNQLAAFDQQPAWQQYQNLQNQYQQQEAALATLRGQVQQMGCNVVFQRLAPAQCRPILQNIDDLDDRVDDLERALRAARPTVAPRESIAAAIRQRCNGVPAAAPVAVRSGNTYRTVCVRPADGYFFPVHFLARTEDFEADADYCAGICVGASLYMHRNPGETIENAVNLAGERYVDLPTAFLYRENWNPDNACRPDPVWVEARARETAVQTAAVQPARTATPGVPVPRPRPVQSEDPETLLARAGGTVTPGAVAAAIPRVEESGGLLVAREIRLIGPAFYYAR